MMALAKLVAAWFARPSAIVALPVVSVVMLRLFGANNTTFVLSIIALTMSQLILLAGADDTRAIKAAVAALVKVNPHLPDSVEDDQ